MRTWAEIDLDALKFNFESIRSSVKPTTKIMSVVKADAYGHGYEECCKTLLECGTEMFAVATVSEAKQVRKICPDTPILILGAVQEDDMAEVIEYNTMPAVTDVKNCEALDREAKKAGKIAKIHIVADTGMSRLGFVAGDSDTVSSIVKISKLPNIEIDGIFSHFACADEENPDYTLIQFDRFKKLIAELEAAGVNIPVKHIANSAAIIMYPEMQLDMVRPGIILYGCYPSDEVDKTRLPLKPVMTVKSRITLVKETEKGVGVSYGKEYITEGPTRLATVPIGYADGYVRALKNRAKMEVSGELCDVVGRICMDQCMIDVTNVNNISIGDEVTVFGSEKITLDTFAGWLNTITYEVSCLVSARVPRIYKKGGKITKAKDYLDGI